METIQAARPCPSPGLRASTSVVGRPVRGGAFAHRTPSIARELCRNCERDHRGADFSTGMVKSRRLRARRNPKRGEESTFEPVFREPCLISQLTRELFSVRFVDLSLYREAARVGIASASASHFSRPFRLSLAVISVVSGPQAVQARLRSRRSTRRSSTDRSAIQTRQDHESAGRRPRRLGRVSCRS